MADFLFDLGNQLALISWVALALSLFIAPMRRMTLVWARICVPVLLAVAYVGLLVSGDNAFADGGFDSLTRVRALFAHDNALAAGWLHYLAFDLFVGVWIVEMGLKRGVHPLLILICLPLTFMFGPAGLLLFFLIAAFTLGKARKES